MSEGSAEASGAESPLLPAEEITAPARAARESEWISFINLRSATREEVGGCNGCTAKTETVTLVVLRSIEFRLCDECRESLSRMLANEPAPILVDGRVMRGDVEIEPKCPICGTAIVCPCGVGIGT